MWRETKQHFTLRKMPEADVCPELVHFCKQPLSDLSRYFPVMDRYHTKAVLQNFRATDCSSKKAANMFKLLAALTEDWKWIF